MLQKFNDLIKNWEKNKSTIHAKKICIEIVHLIYEASQKNQLNKFENNILKKYLDFSRKPEFLISLENHKNRNLWAEGVFKIIQYLNFSFNNVMIQRVNEHPDKVLFQDRSSSKPINWSYKQAYHHIKEIASVFYKANNNQPRVALYMQNSVETACCDLACLLFDIYNTPLSVHFDKDVLIPIFNKLKISIAVTDSKDRLKKILEVHEIVENKFTIYTTTREYSDGKQILYLDSECKKKSTLEVENILKNRKIKPVNQVATTMFTSGSTGVPKGVSFSYYNLVSKRFARAAAVPHVGNDEVFICYLPLFHTFGRYLEMMGSVFWSGTYTLVGNTSKESLLALFPEVNPSVFISIPLRWQQLYEKCIEKTKNIEDKKIKAQIIKNVIGDRLKWGLSAAGYLSPKVFRYFQSHGVALCSGFGMTEASGGITMTPIDNYIDDSTGIVLPGIKTRLKESGELELSGHYLARYLEDAENEDIIEYPKNDDTDYWLSTGDIFTIDKNGFHEIIDRVKDIYKNNKGQTIAPRIVEQKFINVQGINRTFLVGDGKPYNVLLIVPNYKDPMLQSIDEENQREYFHQIVMAANTDLAPYERVVNFSLLDRDFNVEKGELTPKGSFNRKTIEHNFSHLIKQLYASRNVQLKRRDVEIHIPRWFYRDLGILEDDVIITDNALINKRNNTKLTIINTNENEYQIGNLIYQTKKEVIDLGDICKQPKIWLGNPEIIKFCAVKEGWDLPLKKIYDRVFLPKLKLGFDEDLVIKGIRDLQINDVNRNVIKAIYADKDIAIEAIEYLGKNFSDYDKRIADVIRRRLEALSCDPDEKIRVTAYRVLLLDDPNPDYTKSFPAFIQSGMSFLNEESINLIAKSNLGRKHLDALRKRLYVYRSQFDWPVDEPTRLQFENLLKLIFNFASRNLTYYYAIRSELTSWALLKKDILLSKVAHQYVKDLDDLYNNYFDQRIKKYNVDEWKKKIVFETGISIKERERLLLIFTSTNILHKSTKLIFNEQDFDFDKIKDKGLWIVKMLAYKEFLHYRISINTNEGKHFDIHLVKSESNEVKINPETFLWHATIGGHPYGSLVLPLLGCNNNELGILTTQYIGGLSLWDKIREYSEIHKSIAYVNRPNAWRKMFIKAFASYLKAWQSSGYEIVPGSISPNNSVVPEMDFRENAIILTLSGFKPYTNTLSLLRPMVQNFYCKTAALHPWTRKFLQLDWIFDAYIEALGEDEAYLEFDKILKDLQNTKLETSDGVDMYQHLQKYIENAKQHFYFPIAMHNAIEQYKEWEEMNPSANSKAKEQTVFELMDLFKINKYKTIVRFYLYRHTYYNKSNKRIKACFNKLLQKMEEDTNVPPVQLVELSELQTALDQDEDRLVFSKMVFPHFTSEQKLDLLRVVNKQKDEVIISSELTDKNNMNYKFRKALNASEVGALYHLFFKENYPKEISSMDRHYVLIDNNEQIIGGLCYRMLEENVVLLDGMVITSALQGRGIGSAMIEDFFTRMSTLGIKVVKAHFLFGNYYLKHNFKVDKQWGALVRFI